MNRNDTPVTAKASSDPDEAKDQLKSSQGAWVGYSLEDLYFAGIDIALNRTKEAANVAWRNSAIVAELQALKQAGPANNQGDTGVNGIYNAGFNSCNHQWRTLIDTHIARIGGEK